MNIYISNLGHQINDESLRATFATYGQVIHSKVILDQFTGYSRGFAFVEMPNDAEAGKAIAGLNGAIMDGRAVSVEEAKPKDEKKGSYAIGSGNKK